MQYGDARLDGLSGARLDVEHLAYAYEPDEQLLHDVSFGSTRAAPSPLVGATASGKSTLTSLLTRLVDPDGGAVKVDGTDLRDLSHGELARSVSVVGADRVPLRRHRPRQHHPRRRHPRRGRLGGPAHRPGRRLRRRPARRARHPAGGARHLALGRPAAADLPGPGAGPPAAAADPRRRHLGGRPGGRGPDPRARCAAPPTAPTPPWSWSPTARPPSGWPTRSSTSPTAGSSTAAPTPSCWCAARRTPTWSTPTSSETAG